MLTKRWPADPSLLEPRSVILLEAEVADAPSTTSTTAGSDAEPSPAEPSTRFEQTEGPFTHYSRTVTTEGDEYVERTRYRLDIPWFGWLFGPAVRAVLARSSQRAPWAGPR